MFDLKQSLTVRCQNLIGSYASTHSTFSFIGPCDKHPNIQSHKATKPQSHKATKIHTTKPLTYELFFQNTSKPNLHEMYSHTSGTWKCWTLPPSVKEFELSHSNLVNRIRKITNALNLHVKMLDFTRLLCSNDHLTCVIKLCII